MIKKFVVLSALCFFSAGNAFAASPEYDACYQKAQTDNEVALCMKAENARLLKEIQQIYANLAKHNKIKPWNKGNGLVNGNLRDMYNSWLAYRNRYCSLYETASEGGFGGASFNRERCLLSFTNDHYEMIQSIIVNANSAGEEDDMEE